MDTVSDNSILNQVLHTPATRALPRPNKPSLSSLLESLQLSLEELPGDIFEWLVPPLDIDIAGTLAAVDRTACAGNCAAIWVCAYVGSSTELAHNHRQRAGVLRQQARVHPGTRFLDVLRLC